jgi:energy-coupling factor transport system ATP-binding protein
MDEAAMADRIIIMEYGKIVLDGTPKEVFREADYIESLSLDVPFAVQAAHKLRGKGISVPADIIDTDELAAYLCRYN